jgi:two-component system chemotaxis response regulator CheY
MEKLFIVLVEDQPEVLRAIANDMEVLEEAFVLEECSSADEAWEIINQVDAAGDQVALIVSDHVMPKETGVDFLIRVNKDARFKHTRKILLTGLATHQDTIQAINQAAINRYIEKPWKKDTLVQVAKMLITEYLLEVGIDYQDYAAFVDRDTLLRYMQQQRG